MMGQESPSCDSADDTERRCDVVLEGGGVKGIALVGALQSLEDHGYQIERVAGSSVGAVVGCLVAAGIRGSDLMAFVNDFDYQKLLMPDRPSVLPNGLRAGLGLATRGWAYSGDYLRQWIETALGNQNVRTFRQLRRCDPGASGPAARYRLMVTATDVTRCEFLRLPYDYTNVFGVDPDRQSVVDAVCASAAFPFVFRPVTIPPGSVSGSRTVDGGFLSNFPIDAFDRTDGKPPRWPTFGIKLFPVQRDLDTVKRRGALRPPALRQLRALLLTMLVGRDQAYLRQPWVAARTIMVDTSSVGILDTRLGKQNRQSLLDAGREQMDKFLSTWNFECYKTTFRLLEGAIA
jgi:NTE family protein